MGAKIDNEGKICGIILSLTRLMVVDRFPSQVNAPKNVSIFETFLRTFLVAYNCPVPAVSLLYNCRIISSQKFHLLLKF